MSQTITIRPGDNVQQKALSATPGDTVLFDGPTVNRVVILPDKPGITYTGTLSKVVDGGSPGAGPSTSWQRYMALDVEGCPNLTIKDLTLIGGGLIAKQIGRLDLDGFTASKVQGDDDRWSSGIWVDQVNGGTWKRLRFTDMPRAIRGVANGVYGHGLRNVALDGFVSHNVQQPLHLMNSSGNHFRNLIITQWSRHAVEYQGGDGKPWGILERFMCSDPIFVPGHRVFPLSFANAENKGIIVRHWTVIMDKDPFAAGASGGWVVEADCDGGEFHDFYAAGRFDLGFGVAMPTKVWDGKLYIDGQSKALQSTQAYPKGNPRVDQWQNVVYSGPSAAAYAAAPNPVTGQAPDPLPSPGPRQALKVTEQPGGVVTLETPDGSEVEMTGSTSRVTVSLGRGRRLEVRNLVPGWDYSFKAPGFDPVTERTDGTPPADQSIDDFYRTIASPFPQPLPTDIHAGCRAALLAKSQELSQATATAASYQDRLTKIAMIARM